MLRRKSSPPLVRTIYKQPNMHLGRVQAPESQAQRIECLMPPKELRDHAALVVVLAGGRRRRRRHVIYARARARRIRRRRAVSQRIFHILHVRLPYAVTAAVAHIPCGHEPACEGAGVASEHAVVGERAHIGARSNLLRMIRGRGTGPAVLLLDAIENVKSRPFGTRALEMQRTRQEGVWAHCEHVVVTLRQAKGEQERPTPGESMRAVRTRKSVAAPCDGGQES